jgi:signal transduction histidine kinase
VGAIRGLKLEEAGRHFSAELRGVVIGEAEANGQGFAMEDESGGIYIRGTTEGTSRLHPGDEVEVKGVVNPGEFAPYVVLTDLKGLGRRELPAPKRVTFEELTYGFLDAQWVEISGIVRSCEADAAAAGPECRLELATGNGRLMVRWNVAPPAQSLVDAEVKLRGVCYYEVNTNRQAVAPLLAIPHEIPIAVEKAAPADPFGLPREPIASLFRFAPEGDFGHRVRVRGVVSFQQRHKAIWIQGENAGIGAQTRQDEELTMGDVVDVVGFPAHGPNIPVLEDAVFRRVAGGAPPVPLHLTSSEDAFNHDGMLVQLDATLEGTAPAADGWALMLHFGDRSFRALLPFSGEAALPREWERESRVRLTGICSALQSDEKPDTGLWQPRSFQILMRSGADLTVTAPPPWWTRQRVIWVLGAVAMISVFAVGGVMLMARLRLKEQAAQRAMAEREFSAILAERNRMAREIHDTLAQGLGAISVQMELAKGDLKEVSPGAGKHLELAHGLVRTSLTEVRRAIWNMRSQVLENSDLATAISEILKQMTNGAISSHFALVGELRRLPPVIENAVLRIGQEAITNAVKHAQATNIEVTLEFEETVLRLRISDNGRGFNVTNPSPGNGSFGLLGMRERAAQIRSELTLQSRGSQGSVLTLTVPVGLARSFDKG